VERGHCRLVLVDVHMPPGMDGYEFLDERYGAIPGLPGLKAGALRPIW